MEIWQFLQYFLFWSYFILLPKNLFEIEKTVINAVWENEKAPKKKPCIPKNYVQYLLALKS